MKKSKAFIIVSLMICGILMTSNTSALIEGIRPPSFDIQIKCYGYVKDLSGIPIQGAMVELLTLNGQVIGSYEFTSASGYYSVSAILEFKQDVIVRASYDGVSKSVTRRSPGTYRIDFNLRIQVNKIAYFLFDGKETDPNIIGGYSYILANEGFNIIEEVDFFEDSRSWEDCISEINNQIEDPNDFVFIYLNGHGSYLDPPKDNSNVDLNQANNVISDEFNSEISTLYSDRIFILVEACFSGGFSDLYGPNRFIITSTDYEHVSMRFQNPYEGYFSHYFFEGIDLGYKDITAFNYAKNIIENDFYSNQNPQYNDQQLYSWFVW